MIAVRILILDFKYLPANSVFQLIRCFGDVFDNQPEVLAFW